LYSQHQNFSVVTSGTFNRGQGC